MTLCEYYWHVCFCPQGRNNGSKVGKDQDLGVGTEVRRRKRRQRDTKGIEGVGD